MNVRDLILFAIVFGAIPFVLRRPFLGFLLWIWIGVMNPQQLTWGAARTFPFAMTVAIATFVGMVLNRNLIRFKGGAELALLIVLFLWMSLTTITAFNPDLAYLMWDRVAKIQLMTLVGLLLVNTKKELDLTLWVLAVSIAYYGIKGGLFTLLTGGGHRVYGPGDSVVGDNNAIALALVMTIPLLVYLRSQAMNKWIRLGLVGASVLCGAAALGSQSRGAFVAVSAMLFFLWLKSRKKVLLAFMMILMIPPLIGFMPDSWERRMSTIGNYQMDQSAMQRLNSWETAINIANDRPLVGGGFNLTTASTFVKYSPRPEWVLVAHSIYFQMLGEHGWVGLVIFVMLWFVVWRRCARLVKTSRGRDDLAWLAALAPMIQVSLIAYLVGGAFLSLAYWDAPYYLVVVLVSAAWAARNAATGASANAATPATPSTRGHVLAG